jgi:methyl-accepting chemotaxis protein
VKKILKGAEAANASSCQFRRRRWIRRATSTRFHKNPKHQALKRCWQRFTSTYVANLEIGDRTCASSASPVINDKNERLGAVAEWLDRTDEVAIEKEVAAMVGGALRGNFETRLALSKARKASFATLSEGLNQMPKSPQNG